MKYVSQDITTVNDPAIILHGVNCQGTMESGVAKALFSKWPQVKKAYLSIPIAEMILGKIMPVQVEDHLYVVNCWTQDHFGYDQKVYAHPQAIQSCLQDVATLCEHLEINNVFAPRIGCGLGGLNWEQEVQPLFAEITRQHPQLQITICDFSPIRQDEVIRR